MRTKVVLKKDVVRKFYLHCCLRLLFVLCLIGGFFGVMAFFDVTSLREREILFLLILYFVIYCMYLLMWYGFNLKRLRFEMDHDSVYTSPTTSLWAGRMQNISWNQEIQIEESVFKFFPSIKHVCVARDGFMRWKPFILTFPTRDWIENTAEVDAILANVPSSRLSDLFRSPCDETNRK